MIRSFLFDLKSGEIIWKQILGKGQRIYAMAIAPDHSVYINYMYMSAINFKIVKYNFNVTDRKNIQASTTTITELEDEDSDEKFKPTVMLVTPGITPGTNELYVSRFDVALQDKVVINVFMGTDYRTEAATGKGSLIFLFPEPAKGTTENSLRSAKTRGLFTSCCWIPDI